MYVREPNRVWLTLDGKPAKAEGLTATVAKEILGWEEEGVGKFQDDFLLLDKYGKKIRCLNNLYNRPYYSQNAEDWMLEILRDKWKFNGETVIVDKYGGLEDGQHRLIGLVLAVQEWEIDRKRSKGEQLWQRFWKEEPEIDALVVLGIDDTDDVVGTIGTGKPRTLQDELYRHEWFRGKPNVERLAVSKLAAWAVKLLWFRTASDQSSYAPRRPHSESLEFITNHLKILECVKFINDEAGDKKLGQLIPLGTLAGLMYLMGSSSSDSDKYDKVGNEKALEWDLWDKAQEFIVDFAANGKATEPLREALLNIPAELSGGYVRDLRCGLVIKAWNLFSDKKKITKEGIEIAVGQNDEGQPILAEVPMIGGIDVGIPMKEKKAPVVARTPKAKAEHKAATEGKCPRGGEHEWVEEDGETFCSKCKDPKFQG